jgi:hypothetical protein
MISKQNEALNVGFHFLYVDARKPADHLIVLSNPKCISPEMSGDRPLMALNHQLSTINSPLW